jgi:murein DD-endopeptidase MepM/ murein hydrolase activator NlpD
MRFPRLAGLAGLVVMFLALAASLPAGFDTSGVVAIGAVAEAGELEDAQQELERIQKLIEEKQAEFQRLESQKKSVLRDLDRIEQELEGLQADLRYLQRQLSQTEANIAQAEVDIGDAQERLGVRNGLMLTRMRAMSEVGYVNYLEVVLGSRSFADFLARFELLRQVLASDVGLFRQVREEKRQLEVQKAYLEEQRAGLVRLKTDTAARKAAVEEKQEAKEVLLSRLKSDQRTIEEALDELDRLSKELEDYILQIQLARQREGGKPDFQWPAGGPITSRFGPRYHPILHVTKQHTGIDIAAGRGNTVEASAPGYVIMAGWVGGYGKCVILDHGGYWSTLYAHLDSISVTVNTQVTGGEEVGHVGSTGYSTGPHLHFEIRFRGAPQDPMRVDLLPAR